MRNYTPLSEKLLSDGSNIAGVLAGLEERKDEVEKVLTKYLKDLPERDIKRIWTEPVGKFGNDAMLYCQEGWKNQPTHEVDDRGMSDGKLKRLADTWPELAIKKISLGDATIKDVAEYYAQMGCSVEILTGDKGLKSYEPAAPIEIPRRRQRV